MIVEKLPSEFSYESKEDVTIEFNGTFEMISNFNSLIPVGDCAQGWLCCYAAFDDDEY